MKTIKSTFLIIIIACSISAQNYKVDKLAFSDNKLSVKLSFEQINYSFENKDGINKIKFDEFSLNGQPGQPVLPYHIFFVALPPNSKIDASIKINHVNEIEKVIPQANSKIRYVNDSLITYEETELDINAFQSDIFPPKEIEIVGYQWMKDNYVAEVKINTHRYDWRQQKLIVIDECNVDMKIISSGNYQINTNPLNAVDELVLSSVINPEQARMWQSINPNISIKNSSENWIDYSKEYMKFGVIKDGIQRISFSDLQNYGLNPSSVNPKTFKLFVKGEQIPIFVKGELDNSFDEKDFIEFYAEKNYGSKNYSDIVSIGTDYLNYFDRYSDTSHIWLSWGGGDGLRVNNDSTAFSTISDTLNTTTVKVHQEKDVRLWYYDAVSTRTNMPFWQENKVWTWQFIGNSGNKTFSFYAYDVLPNSDVKITSRLISNAANIQINAHRIGASLNSTIPQDTIDFDYKKTVNFSTTFNSNNLVNGKNTYRIFGLPSSASFHQVLIDWVDIEYNKSNIAQKDSVLITVPESIQTSVKVISIKNIAGTVSDLLVYKVYPSIKKISNINLDSNGQLTFADTVKAGDKYLVVSNDFLQTPKFYVKKYFNNIRTNNIGADYLIISNSLLKNSSIEYKNFIESEYGLRTNLVFVNDIYDEFNYGNPSSESLKDFILHAYKNWASPQPAYLLLIGDANYDYKDALEPAPVVRKKNLVPSYGMPVSDVWYTILDSSNVNFQNLLVGRIPANSDDEVYNYLNKHQKYKSKKNDDWNKRYFLFSGGDPTKVSELQQIKSTNDFIMNEYVSPKPVGGYSRHFYKTVNPVSNLGPVTQEEFQNEINQGAMFISYIGHSGTQTWDNGITDVRDLKSKFNNRLPLITDFGCSTGRFAEPDVNAFSELFVAQSDDGQAISYLGNSSYGYLSTSLSFPKLFYKSLMNDSVLTLGKTHFYAKNQLFLNYGISEVNRVFNYCNLLFGDPIIEFALPELPNLRLIENSFSLTQKNPNDKLDSVVVNFIIENTGKVYDDSLSIKVVDNYHSSEIFSRTIKVPIPLLQNEMNLNIPVLKKTGEHQLSVYLDYDSKISELDESDNYSEFRFNIYPSSVRTLNNDDYYSVLSDSLKFLNPIQQSQNEKILLQIADNKDFIAPQELSKSFDIVKTNFNLSVFQNEKRYWFREKIEGENDWSSINSFIKSNEKYNWKVDSTAYMKDIQVNNVSFDSTKRAFGLINKLNEIEITSAGGNDGKFASFMLNGREMLPNTFFWGIATVLMDTLTYEPKEIKYFVYPSSTSAPAMIEYLQSLPARSLIAITICDDGAQSVLGYTGGTAVRNEIKNFGSALIDDVRYRESWCMIGKKGAPTGSVPEVHKKLFEGMAVINTSVSFKTDSGSITFPKIKNSSDWIAVFKNDSIPSGTSVKYFPIGIKPDGITDTLTTLNFIADSSDIKTISAKDYPELVINAKLYSNELKESPAINSVAVRYKTLPELAVNYQVVNVAKDSIDQGKNFNMNFSVRNIGEVKADSFNIKANLYIKNSFVKTILDTLITELQAGSKNLFDINYLTNLEDGFGDSKINIVIDEDNRVHEFYEDNNIYTQSFYIIKDTVTSITSAKMSVFFDDIEIVDGDYVSDNPEIKFELAYQSQFPYDDTTAVKFYLDNKMIYYSSFKNITYDTIRRIVTFTYSPKLQKGEHELRIVGDELIGNSDSQNGYYVTFNVSDESRILNAFNYPNPVKTKTDFTFTLTQAADEVKIKIFTVAGRLIREIKSNSVNINFNKISWDGRDQDGDLIANGVYLYKIIVKKNDKTDSVIQKLAVLR
jgi:hypothetical protein